MRTGSSLSRCHFLTGKSFGGAWAQPELRALGEVGDKGKWTLPGGMGFVKAGAKSQKARAPSMKQGPGWDSASVPRGSLCGQRPALHPQPHPSPVPREPVLSSID